MGLKKLITETVIIDNMTSINQDLQEIKENLIKKIKVLKNQKEK